MVYFIIAPDVEQLIAISTVPEKIPPEGFITGISTFLIILFTITLKDILNAVPSITPVNKYTPATAELYAGEEPACHETLLISFFELDKTTSAVAGNFMAAGSRPSGTVISEGFKASITLIDSTLLRAFSMTFEVYAAEIVVPPIETESVPMVSLTMTGASINAETNALNI